MELQFRIRELVGALQFLSFLYVTSLGQNIAAIDVSREVDAASKTADETVGQEWEADIRRFSSLSLIIILLLIDSPNDSGKCFFRQSNKISLKKIKKIKNKFFFKPIFATYVILKNTE